MIIKVVINVQFCPMETFFYTMQPYYMYPGYRYSPTKFPPSSIGISSSELNLRNHLRMLWEQHIVWTRMTLISMIEDLPDVDLVVNRLLQNPVNFQKALIPFYGNKIASQFSDLLKSHLVIAAQLVKASKAGDEKAAADAEKKWYANADEISRFLSTINPYWSQEVWQQMLYKHLALTKSEAVDMLTKNYAEGIKVYDEIENQALQMADLMAEGLVKQFPNKFS